MKDNLSSIEKINHPLIFIAINFFLVSLMLACFAFILGRFFQLFSPGWQTTGFAAFAFLVALESLILRYSQRAQSKVLYNHILYTIAEIIFIILIVKIFSVVLDPSTNILQEISSWSDNFFQSFFDNNTLLRVLGIIITWAFTWLFSSPLNELKEDQDLMAQEKLGHTYTDRYEARRGLIRLIFVIGLIMLVLMSLLNNISTNIMPRGSADFLLLAMLIYFGTAFILLALNQYAIMKARWYLNDVPVSQDLSTHWIVYTFVFIMVVVLLIIFLPTDFTVGLRPIAGVIINILIIFWSIIQFLFMLPLSLLFPETSPPPEGDSINEIIQQERPEIIPFISQPTGPAPWFDILKSVLFWLIFLFIIGFAVYYFIKNKYGFEFFFKQLKIGVWMKDLWQWLKNRLAIFQQSVTETIKNSSEKIKAQINRGKQDFHSITDRIKVLPPRQAIILNYIDWLHWNAKNGRKRKKSQTPLEFAETCSQDDPQASALIHAFTKFFITARYSKQKITKEQSRSSQMLLQQLKESFRQQQTM